MLEVLFVLIATLGGKMGVIDDTGRMIIPFEYDMIRQAEDGLFICSKLVPFEADSILRWGVLDLKGQEIIPFRYDEIGLFREGVANAKLNGQWAFIDLRGELMFAGNYEQLGWFTNGFAGYEVDSKIGFINRNFKEITPPVFTWAAGFYSDQYMALIKYDDNTMAYIDTSGQEVFRTKDQFIVKIGSLNHDILICYNDANHFRAALFNLAGEQLTDDKYEDLVFQFKGDTLIYAGMNSITHKGELVLANLNGNILKLFTFDTIAKAHGDNFIFGRKQERGTSLGMMDQLGNVLIPSEYLALKYLHSFKGDSVLYDFILARKESGFGVLGTNNKVVMPFAFPKLRWLSDEYFMEDRHDGSLIFDLSGNTVFAHEDIWIGHQLDHVESIYFARNKENKCGYYNIEEKRWVLEPIYDQLGSVVRIEIKN